MLYSNSFIFIVSNTKTVIFSTVVPSETIRFLKYDQSTLYQILSQLDFTQKGNQPAPSDKNLVQTSQTEIK